MTRLAAIFTLLAGPALAQATADISGSLLTLQATEAPGAVAEVELRNVPHNGSRDDGDYTVTLGPITAIVTFVWNPHGSDDQITVYAPGLLAIPETLDVPEGTVGIVLLYPLDAVGM